MIEHSRVKQILSMQHRYRLTLLFAITALVVITIAALIVNKGQDKPEGPLGTHQLPWLGIIRTRIG